MALGGIARNSGSLSKTAFTERGIACTDCARNRHGCRLLARPAAKFINRRMRTQQHTNGTKTAVGYVRVSTQEQATEGVSLDAQRDRLRAYCKLHAIRFIDIKAD